MYRKDNDIEKMEYANYKKGTRPPGNMFDFEFAGQKNTGLT